MYANISCDVTKSKFILKSTSIKRCLCTQKQFSVIISEPIYCLKKRALPTLILVIFATTTITVPQFSEDCIFVSQSDFLYKKRIIYKKSYAGSGLYHTKKRALLDFLEQSFYRRAAKGGFVVSLICNVRVDRYSNHLVTNVQLLAENQIRNSLIYLLKFA